MSSYKEALQAIGPSPDNDGTAILISGHLPNGTLSPQKHQLYGIDENGQYLPFWVERVTTGFPVITTDHALIHRGIAYTLSGVATVTDTYNIRLKTPSDSYVHFKPTGISAAGGPAIVELLEGVSGAGGTLLTPRNHNRVIDTPDQSGMICNENATITGGIVLATLLLPSTTSGSQRLGASVDAAEEFVLKKDTEYAIKITEAITGTIQIGYDIFWYEEPSA